MKRLLALFLTLGMIALFMSACNTPTVQPSGSESASTSEPAKKLKIVWLNPLQNYIGYVNQEAATIEAAADYGVELISLGVPTADGIVEKNAQLLEDAIAMKPDAILCVPFNLAMNPGLEKALAAGIPVIASGSDPGEALRTVYVGYNYETFGNAAADMMNEAFGGKANVFIMMSQFDAPNQVESKKAFEERIKKYPGIKVIGFDKDNADMAQAMTIYDAFFRANPDLDTVWETEGVGGVAAVKVAQEQNRKINIIEVDDGQEKLDNIRSGAVYATLAQNFYRMGYESLRAAVEIINGTEGTPTVIDTGIIVVDKTNVDTYEKDMQDAISRIGTPWKK
jgi:ABC-type sugar transport system substrate-binding protein